MGIIEIQNITYEQIMEVISGSEPQDFWLRTSYLIFDGIMYFALLCVLWIILFIFYQRKEKAYLHNAFYSSALVSIIALFSRAIYGIYSGNVISMLTDSQLWIFPILTAVLGAILWASKRD